MAELYACRSLVDDPNIDAVAKECQHRHISRRPCANNEDVGKDIDAGYAGRHGAINGQRAGWHENELEARTKRDWVMLERSQAAFKTGVKLVEVSRGQLRPRLG